MASVKYSIGNFFYHLVIISSSSALISSVKEATALGKVAERWKQQ